jgi:hypothetical protein
MSSKDLSPVAEAGQEASPGLCSQPIPADEMESSNGYVLFKFM